MEEIQTLNKLNNKRTLSPFHINCCSLSKNIEDLEYLLNSASINFDVIAISETRIAKDKTPVNNLNLINYSHEFCPTESSVGGTLLHIRNHLSYKPRNDLCIYKATELESSFIEISNPKRSIIIGCIYRHPDMDLDEFNNNYLNIFCLINFLRKINLFSFLVTLMLTFWNMTNMHQQMNSWTHFLHICFYHISSNQLESVLLPKLLLIIFSQIFILQVLR